MRSISTVDLSEKSSVVIPPPDYQECLSMGAAARNQANVAKNTSTFRASASKPETKSPVSICGLLPCSPKAQTVCPHGDRDTFSSALLDSLRLHTPLPSLTSGLCFCCILSVTCLLVVGSCWLHFVKAFISQPLVTAVVFQSFNALLCIVFHFLLCSGEA